MIQMQNLNFGDVINYLAGGNYRAYRRGWNGTRAGKEMWIYVEKGKTIPNKVLREPQKSWFGVKDMQVLSHFNLFIDGHVVTGWLASQTDMLAKDWAVF